MIDLKDIAGISDPLKRLIEVVAEGIGGVAKPLLLKANTDAKVYEIRKVTEAIAKNQDLIGPIKYEDGKVTMESIPQHALIATNEVNADQKIGMRISYQQAKKQVNIENVIQYAVTELENESEVVPEKPENDWITRFFNISEDISSDDMQALWGKILAGEIKRPGSYSLRTLELLRNLSQKEAELFVTVCEIAVIANDKVIIPIPDNGKYIEEKFGISFLNFLYLQELGLLATKVLNFQLLPSEENSHFNFLMGTTLIITHRTSKTPKQSMNCYVFTEIGKQLFNIITHPAVDLEYIKWFCNFWRNESVSIKIREITEIKNNGISYTNLRDLSE